MRRKYPKQASAKAPARCRRADRGRQWLHCAHFLGFEQRLADAPVQAHLVVDGLAQGLELLLVFVLSRVEQLAGDAVVQVD